MKTIAIRPSGPEVLKKSQRQEEVPSSPRRGEKGVVDGKNVKQEESSPSRE